MNNQHQPHINGQQQQNYEEDYQNQQQNDHLEVIISQKQPPQKFVSLAKPDNNTHANNQVKNQKNLEERAKIIEKLNGVLHSKIEQVKEIKKNIANCRKQIKEIGEEVDRQMNKSIVKHSKPHTNISIQQIFQTTKSSDPQITHLNNQLTRIRGESKKIKTQIKSIENHIQGPLNMINFQRATQTRTKIKQYEIEIKQLKQQKQYLQAELKMIENNQSGDLIQNSQQIKINRSKNTQLLNQLKEQKYVMYELEKQDRQLTQKIRYVEELEQNTQVRKSRATVGSLVSKEQIQISIKQVLEQIRDIIQKRNKVQGERKGLMKSIEGQVASLSAKNWDLVNKLRQIDSKLFKHYNSKLKKTKPRKQSPHEGNLSEDIQFKRQKGIQNSDTTLKTVYVPKNDKNINQSQEIEPQQVVLVEKRKVYQFFMNPSQNQQAGNIVLNDEMLASKLNIKRLSFVLDEQILYGVSTQYENEHKCQIKGYKIISKIRPKDVVTKTLVLDTSKGQVINLVHIGIDKNQNVKYLHLITSQAKQFKWGNLQNCEKNEQKNIRKHESILIKGKLNQIGNKQAPNYYCLAGLGFSIIYLSPK